MFVCRAWFACVSTSNLLDQTLMWWELTSWTGALPTSNLNRTTVDLYRETERETDIQTDREWWSVSNRGDLGLVQKVMAWVRICDWDFFYHLLTCFLCARSIFTETKRQNKDSLQRYVLLEITVNISAGIKRKRCWHFYNAFCYEDYYFQKRSI